MRIVVLGYIVRGPLGGLAWHHLQYVLGLLGLGHDVLYVEDSDDHEWSCYDPSRGVTDTDPTFGLAFAKDVFERAHAGRCWSYFDAHRNAWHGPAAREAVAFCERADLVLNLGGVNPLRPWSERPGHRALVDTDPVFTQLKMHENSAFRERADAHTVFFTYAENVIDGTARLPELDRRWLPTRQPVVLDAWRVTPLPSGPYTTVMQWESYPAREHDGVTYGMKSESFGEYLDLPSRTDARLELAIGSDSAPRDELRRRGWSVVNPLEVAADPWAYQAYIQAARGELTVAKHGYVVSHSGWFSERSAAFLASGRPVVTQDTGLAGLYPLGEGLLVFDDPAGALAAIEEVERRPDAHARAARAVAEQSFAASVVLTDLLERCMG